MEIERVWQLYQQGIAFKQGIDLYETADKNERFFAGDQWHGVYAPDLPKPVVNFIRRACQQKVAQVKVNPTGVHFSAIGPPVEASEPGGKAVSEVLGDGDAALLDALFEADWERLSMDAVNLGGLQDACISGDYILYDYWDPDALTGQDAKGQLRVQAVDNVNYYPGNPNDPDVQAQPWILLARRELTAEVRRQAGQFGMGGQAELIEADGSTWLQSGDLSRRELAGAENSKCVTLLCLWKDAETGRVFAQKSTRTALVRPAWDTRLTRYPVSMMNWETRKNCCHGRAEITGLVPVQRYINQMYAMAMFFTMQSACPKPVFNQGLVKAWSTAVGAAIPVNGDVEGAAKYLAPPPLPADVYSLPERLMRTTLEMAGVTDVSLGNFDPNNYSALMAARETADIPLETVRCRFYAMMEDFARNWLDMTLAFGAPPRWVAVRGGGQPAARRFDAVSLRRKLWNVKIDVGPADGWSQGAAVKTLSGLYSAGVLSARQYVERLPDGYLPLRERLLGELLPGEKQNPAGGRDSE